jgi:hypothetical protein
MDPTFFSDVFNLLLFPVFILQVIAGVLSQAARNIGFLP